MRAWWLWLVVACGNEPPPAKPAAPPPRAIAATSCADAGVILRGAVEVQSPDGPPDREAAIARACNDDHWPQPVLDCIGSSRTPESCIDKLSPELATSYQMALAEWAAKYEASSDLDERQQTISCNAVVDATDRLSGDVTVEHDWVVAARKRMIGSRCTAGWDQVTRQCLIAEPPPVDALTNCVAHELNKDVLAADLAAISSRAATIAAAKQKPASITCAKVVAAYYADANWKDSLDRLSPSDRKKAIAGSRTAMTRACAKDGWDDTLRACLATGGDATCFSDAGVTSRWGYPAFEANVSILPPECDEMRLLTAKLARCTALPQQTRDGIVKSLELVEDRAKDPADDIRSLCAAVANDLRALPGC
jgi:hypothetical protein